MKLLGVDAERLDSLDPAKVTTYLNDAFAPEIRWWTLRHELAGKQVGVIAVARSNEVPNVCRTSNEELREGAI